jgi:tetratricopeptide (TPR) repeat protein
MTVANLVNGLGVLQATSGKHAEAESSFRASFETHRTLLGERHWRTRNAARNVGRSLFFQRRHADALSWMDRALESPDLTDPGVGPGLWGMRAQRAHVLFRLGRRDEAISEATKAIEALERLPSTYAAWPLAFSRVTLGRMLIDMGRLPEAETTLSTAMEYFAASPPADSYRAEAACALAQARLLQQARPEEWERLNQCLPVYRAWGLAEAQVVASLDGLAHTRRR